MKIHPLLILFTFLSFTNFSYSQNQLAANEKVFSAEDGRLFLNNKMPVYLWISASNDSASEKFRLRSDTMPQYTNPMYFDTDGFNSVRTRGLVNNKTKEVVAWEKDIFFPVYGDSQPPDSYTIIQSSYYKTENGKRVYKNEVVIDILSYDMFSGIQNIYYSINGQDYIAYNEQLKIEVEGDIILKYYAVDNVGNSEEAKDVSFKIEK